MKIQELYSQHNKLDKNDEFHSDGPHRYYIKHVEHDDAHSGRFDLIDNQASITAPIESMHYNTSKEAEESFIKLFSMMIIMNKCENVSEAEKTDMSELPPEIIKDLEGNIRKGARDLAQKWANALELVHKAYEVGYKSETVDAEGKKQKIHKPIERPTPQMTGGWKQYEDLIKYAVEQLAKSRGLDDDWRFTK